MSENTAALLVIMLAMVAANAPFLIERPLLVLPWSRQGVHARSRWSRWVVAVSLLAALAGVVWLAQWWIGQAVVGGGVQMLLFLLRVVLVVGTATVLLAVPGWYFGPYDTSHAVLRWLYKPFVHRLFELLVLYALVGCLGFALEASLGSVFAQRWEFYAASFSLFLLMTAPGYVMRYLFRRDSDAIIRKIADGKDG